MAGVIWTNMVSGPTFPAMVMAGRPSLEQGGHLSRWVSGVGIRGGATHGSQQSRGAGCLSIMDTGITSPALAISGPPPQPLLPGTRHRGVGSLVEVISDGGP